MGLFSKHSPEDKLLQKAIEGDRVGLEYLVNTNKAMAYTIAVRLLGNKEDAEEVVQDSFVKAFASLHQFKKTAKFSTWLYRIVYNTALTKKKSSKVSTLSLDESLVNEQFTSSNKNEWDLLQQEERKQYVERALSRLSEEDALVITLHYMGEKNIAEICAIMNKKKSAIKMQLLRGRKQLEGELEKLLTNEMRNLL